MDVRLIPGTVAAVPELVDCGRRAFANDALEHAIFPGRSPGLSESNELLEFRRQRIRKRLQSPGWHYVLATVDSPDSPAKIVGFAGWLAPPPPDASAADRQMEQPSLAIDEDLPDGVDRDAYKYAGEVVDKAKKELLGMEEQRVWYLASLAVDPDYKGKGIASKLVQWGVRKAEEAGLPAYLESSPAAVGVYRRQGFKELGKLSIIKNDESHFVMAMLRTPGSVET
ncbi:Acyl-CoA N-acyltransferase [Niveomyces insectorum RCEF 264]|uniref:Acyl-CoA N-acyltransferase n=1 Tax=Niveomyces insectorum RCEF 264 TaxID=1081102 RepID=A0A167XXV9_9HYPO|nr:Acyl-CoA N-acyltransferase [Niveomyces insectorum RCEF 264]